MIYVIATIDLTPGKRTEFLECFGRLAPLVRAEDGCLEYGPTIDVATSIAAQDEPRENTVTVVEKWESIEALEAHLIAPHMNEYRVEVKSLVSSVSLQVLEPA